MLLKRLLKAIRKRLLKFNRVRRVVACSLKRSEDENNAKHWAILMHSGSTIHTPDSDGPDLLVNYIDARMIGQRHVTPNFIRPFGMGREKWK